MKYIDIIKSYKQLESDLESSSMTVGYSCPNGKRLIIRNSFNKCTAIDSRLKICTAKDEDNDLYGNPLELIASYLAEGSVGIGDIVFFSDTVEAMLWLLDKQELHLVESDPSKRGII